MRNGLERILGTIAAGAISLGVLGLERASASDDNYVKTERNHPVALGVASDYLDVPSDFSGSQNRIVYVQKGKLIVIDQGEGENRGNRYVLKNNPSGINHPSIEGNLVVFESRINEKSEICILNLGDVDWSSAARSGNNLYEVTVTQNNLTKDLTSPRTGKKASNNLHPSISGNSVFWKSEYYDPNNANWRNDDELIRCALPGKSLEVISASGDSGMGEKNQPFFAGNWGVYSIKKDSFWSVRGVYIPSKIDFLIDSSSFAAERCPAVYDDSGESGQAIAVYNDFLGGAGGIKIVRLSANGTEIQMDMGENYYNLSPSYSLGALSSKLNIIGKNGTRASPGAGPIVVFQRGSQVGGFNLREWQEFEVGIGESASPNGGWIDSRTGRINLSYSQKYQTPNIKPELVAGIDLPVAATRQFNAAMRAEVTDNPGNYYLVGDLTRDGGVDGEDMLTLASNWLKSNCNASNNWCNGGDINHDGLTNDADLGLLEENLGRRSFGEPGVGGFTGEVHQVNIVTNSSVQSYYGWEDNYFFGRDYWYYWEEGTNLRYVSPPQKHEHQISLLNKSFRVNINRIEIPTNQPNIFTTYSDSYGWYYWNGGTPNDFYDSYKLGNWDKRHENGKLIFEAKTPQDSILPGESVSIWAISGGAGYEMRDVKLYTDKGDFSYSVQVPMENLLISDISGPKGKPNGIVDLYDFVDFAKNYGGTGLGDFNLDGNVNLNDYSILASQYKLPEDWYGRNYTEY